MSGEHFLDSRWHLTTSGNVHRLVNHVIKEELELCRVLHCLLTSQGNWEEVEKEDISLLPISHLLHVTCKYVCVAGAVTFPHIYILTWGNLQIYLSHILGMAKGMVV